MLFGTNEARSSKYTFTWIPSDASFKGTLDKDAMRLKVESEQSFSAKEPTYHSEIDNIASTDYPIPDLLMNGRTYKRSSVPIILALNLLDKLGMKEAYLQDFSCTTVKYNGRDVIYSIMHERYITGGKSMYGKYGFEPNDERKNLFVKLTIQDMIDDYKVRMDNYVVSTTSRYWKITPEMIQRSTETKKTVIELLNEFQRLSNRNITIGQWLRTYTGNERSCKFLAFMEFASCEIASFTGVDGVEYSYSKFWKLYDREIDSEYTCNQFYHSNKDIKKTVKNIYNNGLPPSS